MTLQEFFFHHPRIALAFSAGVDSAYLLWAARHHGAQVQPYFIQTCFQPKFAVANARRSPAVVSAARISAGRTAYMRR